MMMLLSSSRGKNATTGSRKRSGGSSIQTLLLDKKRRRTKTRTTPTLKRRNRSRRCRGRHGSRSHVQSDGRRDEGEKIALENCLGSCLGSQTQRAQFWIKSLAFPHHSFVAQREERQRTRHQNERQREHCFELSVRLFFFFCFERRKKSRRKSFKW